MSAPVPSTHRHYSKKARDFGALYSAIIILGFHWAIVLYVNSSFLSQFVSDTAIGLLYTASSAVTILTFLFISRVLERAGNYKLTLLLSCIEFGALIGMAMTESLRVALPLFMVHQAIVPLILFNLDIYMEELIGDEERTTGGRRGLLLSIMSISTALSPLAAGYFIGNDEPRFSLVYIASACMMIPFMLIIMRFFRTFEDPKYNDIKVLPALHSFWEQKDIRNVFISHFLLQLFFAWMVIYSPIYLAHYVGFNWEEIGLILFAGLIAYVFFEYPIGIIADRWWGEKEMMAVGMMIMAVCAGWFIFLENGSLGAWMVLMFISRFGASLVEATTESYFFKHTKGADSNIIGFFRITRPLSYVAGALLGSLALLYLPFGLIFVVLGFIMTGGLFSTMTLKDTR